jgi:hypothetical protein
MDPLAIWGGVANQNTHVKLGPTGSIGTMGANWVDPYHCPIIATTTCYAPPAKTHYAPPTTTPYVPPTTTHYAPPTTTHYAPLIYCPPVLLQKTNSFLTKDFQQ